MNETSSATTGVTRSDTEQCDGCGCFGAFVFDGRKLCESCYEGCGSCCPESGPEDKPSSVMP